MVLKSPYTSQNDVVVAVRGRVLPGLNPAQKNDSYISSFSITTKNNQPLKAEMPNIIPGTIYLWFQGPQVSVQSTSLIP